MLRFFGLLSALVLVFTTGCLPEVGDFWASLDIVSVPDMDSGPDADTDADTDSDSDSDTDTDSDGDSDGDTDSESETEECIEGYTCGDGGTDGGPDIWDGGPDAGESFCDSAAYAAYLAGTEHVFNNYGAPFLGNGVDPDVVVTGFSYFLCSHCANAATMMSDMFLDLDYADHTAYYYRHFSFSTDPSSIGFQNHRAAVAAHDQGDFWPLHDALYENFPVTTETALLNYVSASVGDYTQFTVDYSSTSTYNRVIDDRAAGSAAGVTGTPSIFVNGKKVSPWMNVPLVVGCLLGHDPS